LRIGKGIRIFSIREDGKGTFHPFLSAEFIEEWKSGVEKERRKAE
jgi:hypothetical protein